MVTGSAMGRRRRKWIGGAVNPERKGELTRFAAEHGTLTNRGTINLGETEKEIQKIRDPKLRLRRQRQLNFARNVR